MDYKKKYKDALERAKAMIKVADNQDEAIGFVNTIFPELKESEDERIRKGLIKAVSRTFEGNKLFGTDVTREEALAWLEKQGRRNNDEMLQAISIGLSDIKEDVGWSDFGGTPIEEIQEWLEKQGKQKSQRMISAEAKEAMYGKPAWSEEDERAIGIIKIALEHPYDMEGKWDRKFALDWLKSLKQRIGG